ncbi:MAG: thioredoxin domain-containing protein [Desulfobacteraceae bacterium]|jgi:protein-disulfide isomerase
MITEKTKERLIKILIFAGLCAAVLAAIESRVEWVASLCSFMGSGCRETEYVTLLKIPVSIWGVAFYIVLGLMFYFVRNGLFLAVMAGAGLELTLISAMVEMKLVCGFCLVNLVVVFILILLTFDHPRMWQALTLAFFCFLLSDHLLLTRKIKHGPVSVKAPEPSVVAVIGGRTIKTRELEGPLSTKIFKLNSQIYKLKKDRLDFLINSKLIEMDAIEKGLSPEIITYKVMTEGTDVSDSEVETYYKDHLNEFTQWQGTIDELKVRIRQFLREKKTNEKVDEYTKPLREKYPVNVFLTPPPLPITSVSEGDSPAMGPADAAVTVVEYSDYLCPSCRKAHEITAKIKKQYEGRIRWVFKDFPLDRHRNAKHMAEAGRCAGEQGKFWEFQDKLFTSAKNVDDQTLKVYGESLGLDSKLFNECLDSDRYLSLVEKDRRDGREAGVSSTPTFVINGRLSPGFLSFEAFSDLIEQELNKSL